MFVGELAMTADEYKDPGTEFIKVTADGLDRKMNPDDPD